MPTGVYARKYATLKDRFESKFVKTDSCWLWTSTNDGYGYGCIRVNKKTKKAHRISYELYVGKIEDGLVVRHLCNNQKCVNPSHLAVGTHADNVNDKIACGHQPYGETNGNAILTDDAVVEIRSKYMPPSRPFAGDGYSRARLAEEYGVCPSTIQAVIEQRTWRHVK